MAQEEDTPSQSVDESFTSVPDLRGQSSGRRTRFSLESKEPGSPSTSSRTTRVLSSVRNQKIVKLMERRLSLGRVCGLRPSIANLLLLGVSASTGIVAVALGFSLSTTKYMRDPVRACETSNFGLAALAYFPVLLTLLFVGAVLHADIAVAGSLPLAVVAEGDGSPNKSVEAAATALLHEKVSASTRGVGCCRVPRLELAQWALTLLYPFAVWIPEAGCFSSGDLKANVAGLVGLSLCAAFVPIGIHLLANIRLALVEREAAQLRQYLVRLLERMALVLLLQHCCFVYCVLLAFAVIPCTAPIVILQNALVMEALRADACAYIDLNYTAAYCRPSRSATGPPLLCDDELLGEGSAYDSAHSACAAAREQPVFLARGYSAIMLSLNLLFTLLFLEVRTNYVSEVLNESRGRLLFVASALVCLAVLTAMFYLGALLVGSELPNDGLLVQAMSRDSFFALQLINCGLWAGAMALLNLDYIKSGLARLRGALARGSEDVTTRYDVFVSHDWATEGNHAHAMTLARWLGCHGGLRVWVDEERICGDVVKSMAEGIDASSLVLVVVTDLYMQKANGEGPRGADDNCKLEFDYACRRKGVDRIVPVISRTECLDPSRWHGPFGAKIGGQLYYDLTAPPQTPTFEANAKRLLERLRQLLGDNGNRRQAHRQHRPSLVSCSSGVWSRTAHKMGMIAHLRHSKVPEDSSLAGPHSGRSSEVPAALAATASPRRRE